MWSWWSKSVLVISFCFLFLTFCPVQVTKADLITDWQDWSIRIPVDYSLTGFAFFVYDDLAPSLTFSDVADLESGYDGSGDDIADWVLVMEGDNKQFSFAGSGFTNENGSAVWFNFQIEFTWDPAQVGEGELPVHMDSAIYNGGLGTAPQADWKHMGDPVANSWSRDDEPYESHPNPAPEPTTILLLGLGGLFLIKKRRIYG
jgi:hypothetical protein